MTIEEQLDIYEEMRMPFIPLNFPKSKKDLVYCSYPKGRNCDAKGKHPAVFFRGNVGFLTKDFAVFDVDFRHGGALSLTILEEKYGEFPRGMMINTGNGFHIYTMSLMAFHVELLNYPGIDVRSKGGYVVAPPSQHHTGNYYQWESISIPEPLPGELLDAVKQGKGRSKVSASAKSKGAKGNEPKVWTKVPAILDASYRIRDGRRGDELYQIASRERGRGKNYYEILNVLEQINSENCEPPVPKSRLESIAKSASKLPTNAEKLLTLKP